MNEKSEHSFDLVNSQERQQPTSWGSFSGLLSWKYIVLGSIIIGILVLISIGIGTSMKGMSEMYLAGVKENTSTRSSQHIDKTSLSIINENKNSTAAVKTSDQTVTAIKKSNETSVNTYQVSKIKNYCSLLSSYISSAESARGEVSEEDLNRLLDSYNRQKVFCDTLLSRMGDKNTISSDDDAMWESISKLSYESSDLFYKIFGR